MSRETTGPVGVITHGRPEGESCENCFYCLSYIIRGSIGFKPANIEVFECCRNPPVQPFDNCGSSKYPETNENNWCGEWRHR
jgi:hypothetical protein